MDFCIPLSELSKENSQHLRETIQNEIQRENEGMESNKTSKEYLAEQIVLLSIEVLISIIERNVSANLEKAIITVASEQAKKRGGYGVASIGEIPISLTKFNIAEITSMLQEQLSDHTIKSRPTRVSPANGLSQKENNPLQKISDNLANSASAFLNTCSELPPSPSSVNFKRKTDLYDVDTYPTHINGNEDFRKSLYSNRSRMEYLDDTHSYFSTSGERFGHTRVSPGYGSAETPVRSPPPSALKHRLNLSSLNSKASARSPVRANHSLLDSDYGRSARSPVRANHSLLDSDYGSFNWEKQLRSSSKPKQKSIVKRTPRSRSVPRSQSRSYLGTPKRKTHLVKAPFR